MTNPADGLPEFHARLCICQPPTTKRNECGRGDGCLDPAYHDQPAKPDPNCVALSVAIRRSILEARLDEHDHGHRLNTASMDKRREALRKELAALKEGE